MNYIKVKFEIYLSNTYLDKFIKELNNIGSLCFDFEENIYFTTLINNYHEKQSSNNKINSDTESSILYDNIKLEFQCDKDIALEVINLIKKIHLSKYPVYNILPIIN